MQHVFNRTREALLLPLEPASAVIAFSSGAAVNGSPLSGGVPRPGPCSPEHPSRAPRLTEAQTPSPTAASTAPNLPAAGARRAPIGAHAQSHPDALASPKLGP